MLRPILSNEQVRLLRELPEVGIDAGAVGVVRSAWFYPTTAYEVEFAHSDRRGFSRFLLLDGEVAPVDSAESEGMDPYVAAIVR